MGARSIALTLEAGVKKDSGPYQLGDVRRDSAAPQEAKLLRESPLAAGQRVAAQHALNQNASEDCPPHENVRLDGFEHSCGCGPVKAKRRHPHAPHEPSPAAYMPSQWEVDGK